MIQGTQTIDSKDFCAYDGHFWCFYVVASIN
jgi:hypothetical protein